MAAKQLTWTEIDAADHPVLSPSWSYGDLVFASGSVGARPDGSFPDTVEEQTVLALQGLERVLKASGSALSNVLKVQVFIAHPDEVGKMNAIYGKYFPNKPARSCFGVNFPNKKVLVEIECIAFKNPKSML